MLFSNWKTNTVVLSVVLAFASPLSTSGADNYSNKVVRSLAADLTYDENNRLASHVLAYEDSAACQNAGVPTVRKGRDWFDIVAVEGEALNHIFSSSSSSSFCRAVCIDRGVERSLAGNVMPHMYYDNSGDFETWFGETCRKKEACFLNYHNKEAPMNVYWIGKDGTEELMFEIKFGERNTQCFHTFVGHKFVMKDSATGDVIGNVTIESVTVMAFGTSPPSDIRSSDHSFEKEIKSTLHSEWKRHQRTERSFSSLGFKKGRLPSDVFASLGAFYYNNRMNKVREEWKNKGVFVNWWETEVFFIQLPWKLKSLYQARLKTLVEEWAGVPVEETVMYGLRQYESGARLLTHVDRLATHAVSLIVNIAQGNLTEPWPVEVQDHMDRLHEVTMEPGDIVYYESAKALHGRNRPMMGEGAYYVNLFTHYRPVKDPEWYKKPNPEGTPEPLMEVEGECKLVSKGTTNFGSNGELGLVQAVQCDDQRLGPYISPSLFTASGPEDLIDWWRMTSPGSSCSATMAAAADEEFTPDSIPDNDEL